MVFPGAFATLGAIAPLSLRKLKRAGAIAMGAGLLCASACSGGHGSSTLTTLKSLTPRVTTTPKGDLSAGLLSAADLAALPGAPVGLRVVPVNSAALYSDPDPRAPCGAPLAPPPLGASAGEAIQGPTTVGFEFVLPAGTAAATAYVDATAADIKVGCAAYQTRLNTGGLQTERLYSPVSLDAGPDQQSGALLQVTLASGQVIYEFRGVMRVGKLLAIEVIGGPVAPPPEFLRAVAQRGAERLRAVPH